ncbi:Glycine dehydrogenase (decarboxylating) [Streptomyces glaucescens]
MTAHRIPLSELEQGIPFEQRHIGPDQEARAKMLAQIGYGSLDELTAAAVPDVIKNADALDLPGARTEAEVLAELRALADRNQVLDSMIGLGYHGTFTPPVILRNVMENPAWYTAYTPYQPEISQGRLEALLNFQTMVADLTGLPTSGASLLDEGTAAAEAMALSRRMGKNKKGLFLVDADALPQTIAVIQTRAEPTGVEVVVADLSDGIPAEVAEREIEPTESEDLAELDRFCDAMIAIRAEIEKVGAVAADDNPLRNAPHTAGAVGGEWEHAYSRDEAVFPGGVSAADKYWPPVRRIDQAFGDRNLVCSCPPLDAYED